MTFISSVLLLGRAWVSPTLAWLHCARVYACLLVAIYHKFKWARLNFNNTKMEHMHAILVGEAWRAIAWVQRRLPGVETTEFEVHTDNFLLATDHRWQVAHRQYKFRSQQWLRSLQVRAMHELINGRNSAHDFTVKLTVMTLIIRTI